MKRTKRSSTQSSQAEGDETASVLVVGDTRLFKLRLLLLAIVTMCCLIVIQFRSPCNGFKSAASAKVAGSIRGSAGKKNKKITTIEIPIDTLANMTRDILSIHHDPEKLAVIVRIRQGARCARPHLRGRLSGPALAILDWSTAIQVEVATNATVLTGTYQAPTRGAYFLEIVTLYCHDFLRTDRGDTQVQPWENAFDFKDNCMEDGMRHRITGLNASINVVNEWTTPAPGYWIHDEETEHTPLHTRFQPPGCRDADEKKEELPLHCKDPMDLVRFDPYSFRFGQNLTIDHILGKVRQKPQGICFVGASHARYLSVEASHLLRNKNSSITVTWVQRKNTWDFAKGKLEKLRTKVEENGCTKVVIAIGQWPASWDRKKPTLFDAYGREYATMLKDMKDALPPDVEIFARSINYNPMGDWVSQCDPTPRDWRTPIVIDGYNAIISKVVKDLGGPQNNITFVDTNFVVGPTWDSSKDWCHISAKAQTAHALYIMAAALGAIKMPQYR